MSVLEDDIVLRDTVLDKLDSMTDREKANLIYKLKKILEESRSQSKENREYELELEDVIKGLGKLLKENTTTKGRSVGLRNYVEKLDMMEKVGDYMYMSKYVNRMLYYIIF